MTATVPEARNNIRQADTVDVTAIGRPVRSGTWVDAARLQNWLAGRGSMDVPAHAPQSTIAISGSSNFRYWTKPRFQTARYAYSLVLRGSAAGSALVSVQSNPVVTVPVGTQRRPRPFTLFADRTALGTTEAELSFTITATAAQAITVDCVAVEAVPRTELLVSSDLGVDRQRFLVRQPINEASFATELLARQNDLRQACRRVGLFQFSRGTGDPWTTTSTSDADIFASTFSLTGRKLFNGQTSTTSGVTKWRALAKCSDGTTAGRLTLTGSKVLTIPALTTDWTWITGASFSHDCEDNSTADGYQGATPDDHNIALVRTAGSGTVSVASVSFYDIGE